MTAQAGRPTLSVALFSYNHEPFVRQAMDNILGQRTDFDFEVVVGEDCSTDRTRVILQEYADRHPDVVRLLDRPKNIGAGANYVATISACQGEFFALLDSDDYWCDSDKLQKQVDMLRSNPNLNLSFHGVIRVRSDGTRETVLPRGRQSEYTFGDIALYGCVHTSSVVIRRSAFPGFPDWFGRAPCGDWPTFLLATEHGNAGYVDEAMSVYRHHPGGSAKSWRDDRRASIKDAIALMEVMIPEYQGARARDLERALRKRHFYLVHENMRAGDREAALKAFRDCPSATDRSVRMALFEPLSALLHVCLPGPYEASRRFKETLKATRGRLGRLS